MNSEFKNLIRKIALEAQSLGSHVQPSDSDENTDIDCAVGPLPPEEWRQSREAGMLEMAKHLFVNKGERVEVRFLLFGSPRHFLRRVVKHRVHNWKSCICPKLSDTALGGDLKADCPLCEIERVRGMSSRDPIAPRSFLTWFTYVSVTRRWEGAEEKVRDDDKRAVPYRFWPPRDVMETVVKCGRNEPSIFDYGAGRGFILARNTEGRWSVSPSAAQPLFQTSDANQIATLCHRLEGWLAEPAIRPATPEELGEAVQVLRATLKAPRRGSEAFIRSLSPDNS